ncbi:MAG: hypothetical protein Q8O03_06675 [Nanoarchaeota archaeon]|nr:hypothetical protein [Nanoarchaeota archaeon]
MSLKEKIDEIYEKTDKLIRMGASASYALKLMAIALKYDKDPDFIIEEVCALADKVVIEEEIDTSIKLEHGNAYIAINILAVLYKEKNKKIKEIYEEFLDVAKEKNIPLGAASDLVVLAYENLKE